MTTCMPPSEVAAGDDPHLIAVAGVRVHG